jgi:UDP-N-acetylglucosamine:LPS N-acetylglucosamine transferase
MSPSLTIATGAYIYIYIYILAQNLSTPVISAPTVICRGKAKRNRKRTKNRTIPALDLLIIKSAKFTSFGA